MKCVIKTHAFATNNSSPCFAQSPHVHHPSSGSVCPRTKHQLLSLALHPFMNTLTASAGADHSSTLTLIRVQSVESCDGQLLWITAGLPLSINILIMICWIWAFPAVERERGSRVHIAEEHVEQSCTKSSDAECLLIESRPVCLHWITACYRLQKFKLEDWVKQKSLLTE